MYHIYLNGKSLSIRLNLNLQNGNKSYNNNNSSSNNNNTNNNNNNYYYYYYYSCPNYLYTIVFLRV